MADRGRVAGIAAALLAAGLVAAAPVEGLSQPGQFALATMAFAGLLWLTGALLLPVTALLVPVVLVALGVPETLGAAFSGFAEPVMFLLLAGFVLARALAKHGVDRLVATPSWRGWGARRAGSCWG